MARTGRRPGNSDTRETILTAARAAFAERGYDGASIRAIATSAGVDPALVHHYFGSKDQLFLATMQMPVNPTKLIPQIFAEGPDAAGERLIRMFLAIWDSPAGSSAAAVLRSAARHEWMARMMREFLLTQVLRPAARAAMVDPAEAPYRASLVASQVVGLAMIRYILRVEPLATLPPETVVALIAPTVQRYLTGPLPAGLVPATGEPRRRSPAPG